MALTLFQRKTMKKIYLGFTIFTFIVFQLKGQHVQTALDSLNKSFYKCQEDSCRIKILDALSLAYSKIDPKKGLVFAERLKELSIKENNRVALATAYTDLGLNYSAECNYKKSLRCYLIAFKIFDENENNRGKAAVLANISLLYLNQSDYSMALKLSFDALSIIENTEDHRLLASIHENIGTVYLEQKQFKKALRYYSLAYENYIKTADLASVARVNGNKGIILNEKGEYQQALKFHLLALKNNRLKGLKRSEQINLANIAITFGHLNNYQKSLTYHLMALKISQQINDKKSIGVNFGNTGETYLKLAQQAKNTISKDKYLQKGIYYLEQATRTCAEINFNGPLIEFKKYLSEAYASAGKHDRAFYEYKDYSDLKDTVYASEVQKEIHTLETKREIELKNKEIILKEQQREIAQLAETNKKNERIIYLISIILLAIVVLILIRLLRQRLKRHRRSLHEIAHIQSHEVRAPLARILGLVTLLDKKNMSATESRQILSYIKQSAEELDKVTKKIVNKTSDENKKALKKYRFDLFLKVKRSGLSRRLKEKAEDLSLLMFR